MAQDLNYWEPNDPYFSNQWHLKNTNDYAADVDASRAWDLTRGDPNIIVAVINSGIQTNHPDLSANIWTNLNEIPANGLDDDGNGCVDDVHGWNFYNRNGTTTSYSDTTAVPGTTYYSWVKAKNERVESDFSPYNTGWRA
ncbi:MAG: hypothetical protein AB1611_02575 [bacterium]